MPSAYKWVDYTWPAGFTLLNQWTVIWATTGADLQTPTASNFLLMPPIMQNLSQSGATTIAQVLAAVGFAGGDEGVIGDRVWYYKDLDLRFNIGKNATVTATPTVFYRLAIITQRNRDISVLTELPGDLNTPFLNKDWKVRYDKVYAVNTGLNLVVATGNSTVNGQYSTAKNFRLKLPFKYRAQQAASVAGQATVWQPPLNTYVLVYSTTAAVINVSNIVCRQHYINKV